MRTRTFNHIRTTGLKVILIFMLFLMPYFVFDQKVTAEFTDYADTMTVSQREYERNLWTDNQWIFYKTLVAKNEKINISLSYSGDLDLDLRIYVDDDAQEQK
ncbi:MAG: hypothetical protein GF364_17860, partial [Candidatus Lokiarchaeota archaeon]|nr:hypothetical protein [Candidatus Lokiarchaeota archaeon]